MKIVVRAARKLSEASAARSPVANVFLLFLIEFCCQLYDSRDFIYFNHGQCNLCDKDHKELFRIKEKKGQRRSRGHSLPF